MSYPDHKTEAQYRREISDVWGILRSERAAFKDLQQQLEAVRKDAGRYRWLQDQHEGVELNGLDADGVMLPASVRAVAFTVFMPDKWGHESLVPVPIGDLDETIDAAIAASKPAGGE